MWASVDCWKIHSYDLLRLEDVELLIHFVEIGTDIMDTVLIPTKMIARTANSRLTSSYCD